MTSTGTETTIACPLAPMRGFVVEIGQSVFRIFGGAEVGWSLDQLDIVHATPYRYTTLDELMFALLNCTLQGDCSA
jgi:hypothetical protein